MQIKSNQNQEELKKAIISIEFFANNNLYNLFWQEYEIYYKSLMESKYKDRLSKVYKKIFVESNKKKLWK